MGHPVERTAVAGVVAEVARSVCLELVGPLGAPAVGSLYPALGLRSANPLRAAAAPPGPGNLMPMEANHRTTIKKKKKKRRTLLLLDWPSLKEDLH